MALTRLRELDLGHKRLALPVYFPSVSSVKSSLRPEDYLRVLSSLVSVNGQYLLSAFDLDRVERPYDVAEIIRISRNAGAVTLMDSGNYERYWKDAQSSWDQTRFQKTLGAFPCDLAFCFDDQDPPKDIEEHVSIVESGWRDDQAAAGECQVVPIIHCSASALPIRCAAVASKTSTAIIAVAERRLGDGIIERARTVRAIRAALDGQGRYVCLHLLGTGNPIAIALYATMGADSFDGLEWCNTVVDHDTALLYHLSQADFFSGQTTWADSGLSFQARTLAHNLEFYSSWMRGLQGALTADAMVGFCRSSLPPRVFATCASTFGWAAR